MNDSRALISPKVDFFLVGGSSIIALAALFIIRFFLKSDYQEFVAFVAVAAAIISFFINQPHFAFSFQLFYKDFFKRSNESNLFFKWRSLIIGLVIPFLIVYYLAASLFINPTSAKWAVSVMFFTVGWHYVKQGYGVLITLSSLKRNYFSKAEKNILMFNCYAVWLFTWISGHSISFATNYSGLEHQRFAFSHTTIQSFGLVSLVSTVLAGFVLAKSWIKKGRQFSFNGLVGYFCAVYLWMGLAGIDPAFVLIVPAFHSLQYLPFVYRYKSKEYKSENIHPKRLLAFAVVGVILGAVFMDFLPKFLDRIILSWGHHETFYLASFLLFINIQHYFIDHAFWRKENSRVQNYLFQ